jgi:Holliday junction resolvasome RuvABC endonuclease subunit
VIVIGIDPSLTATGIARVDTEDQLYATTTTIASRGSKDADLTSRRDRLAKLVRDIDAHVLGLPYPDAAPTTLVVIEAPSLGQTRQGGTLDRHGLWWMLIDRIHTLRYPVVAVPPTCRAKYATGKGNADKDTVLLAVARRYPHVDVANNNEADALALAAMGARSLGQPIDDLPQAHLEAMVKVPWPARAVA